ncbi:hypothetical protein ACFQYP_45455 [Nonomuraea antimicrobica]
MLVDVAAKKAKVVNVNDTSVREHAFGLGPDGKSTINYYGDENDAALRYFDANGKATRSQPGIGRLYVGTLDVFSPSGKSFVTNCPGGSDGDHCIWDVASGEQAHRFYSDCDKVLGFYDETHLYCWENDNAEETDELQVVDFDGKMVRKLMETPDDVRFSPAFTVNPNRGS